MSRILYRLTLVLSLAGIGVTAYLTWVHYDINILVCGIGDCEVVQTSRYAEIMGIPIAILGLGMYAVLFVLSLVRIQSPRRASDLTLGLFFITLIGTLYSAYLTWLEVYEIKAICQWCVVSAIITTVIFLIETFNVWHGEPDGSQDLTLDED